MTARLITDVIAFQGRPGAYSDLACRTAYPSWRTLPCDTFDATIEAAYEAAYGYAEGRTVFGKPIVEYQLTRAKLARMAVLIQSTRQFSYQVAKLMAKGEGTLEASMLKAYVCRAAEWVTREALQIHGGMGYAEEYAVSRYFVDARVLSIFEGADETLALKVIARRLIGS